MDKTEREVSGHDDIVEGTVSAGRGDLANVEVLAELFRGFHARYRNPHISLQQIAAANDQGKARRMPGLSLCGEFTISKLFFKYIEFFIAFPRILCIMFLFDFSERKV